MTPIPLKIKTTGAVIMTEELRAFIAEKVTKLEKFTDPDDGSLLAEVEVESLAETRGGDLYRAEINLTVKGELIRAEAKSVTLHAAIDEAVAEARRSLRNSRTKHRDVIRRGAARVKEFFKRFGR